MSAWKPGIWRKGKFLRTGRWVYDRPGDRFHIRLDRPIAYGLPGEQRRIITVLGGETPTVGLWIYEDAP